MGGCWTAWPRGLNTKPDPFAVRDGRLCLEDSDLSDLADFLEGRAAWLVGHVAVSAAIDAAGTCTIPIAKIGPPAVLAMLARAGAWAHVRSTHELDLARAAGFTRERIAAGGRVLEDGFLKDALCEQVAVLECDEATAANATRIGAALGLELPPTTGAPPALPAGTFARCGGLLAPLLSDPPSLVMDAVWDTSIDERAEILPVVDPGGDGAPVDVTLEGLEGTGSRPARLHGAAKRGDWVVVPSTASLVVRGADAAHPAPRTVMVRGESWRVLEPRRFPSSD